MPPTWEDASNALPVIGGLFAAGASKTIARENRAFAHNEGQIARDFSERMANTSVQRSVADYRAAGLNPALAYDRSAASPSATAPSAPGADNYAESGINTAMQLKRMRQDMQIAREQNQANVALMKAQGAKANSEALEAGARERETNQRINYTNINQPFQQRLNAANALATEYLLPGLLNQARFDQKMGMIAPAISTAKQASDIIRALQPKISLERNFNNFNKR